MTMTRKLGTAIATGALLLSTVLPAFADTTLTISGNGSSSDNGVAVTTTNNNTVTQTNTANVTNDVKSTASTGGNTGSQNTGGNTLIQSGDATNTTTVDTALNLNKAATDNCGCGNTQQVVVSGNGDKSVNNAALTNTDTANLFQTNKGTISNHIDADSTTGKNDASQNTGGLSGIVSGAASSNVTVNNSANVNEGSLGSTGAQGNSGVGLGILGNGANSINTIGLTNNQTALVEQSNDAYITNKIDADAKSGKNTASQNTNGDVMITGGSATSGVTVDNLANFNAASTGDCGCATTDTLAKVAGNGSQSTNDIVAALGNDSSFFQTNDSKFKNPVSADAFSGLNDGSQNTGSILGGDPVIIGSGSSTNTTSVSNTTNANLVGSTPDLSGLNFTFDLGQLLAGFGL